MAAALPDNFITILISFIIGFFVLILAFYIYSSLTLMITAKRLKKEPVWLAWIPVGNLYLLSKMAKMHWWPMLLVIGTIIPYISIPSSIVLFIFCIIWLYKICEARKRPGWWAIITIIPIVGWIWSLILWGILAWGKK